MPTDSYPCGVMGSHTRCDETSQAVGEVALTPSWAILPPPKLASLLRHRVTQTWTPADPTGRIWTRCQEHVVGMPGLEPGRGLALRILSPVLYRPHVPVKAGFTPYCN